MKNHITEIDGFKISWNRAGEGKPILLLHGWGSDSKAFRPVVNQIQDIRTCYLPDFPGFGNSQEPEHVWTVTDYADAAEAFINKHIPEGKFDLLVHSFGARVAIKLLTRSTLSKRVDKVIFTGAAGLRPKRSGAFYFRKYTAKTLKLPFFLLPGKLREHGLNRLRKTALWKKLGSSDYQQLGGVMRDTFIKVVTEHLDNQVPQINHEILLIWGRDDSATPLEQGERFGSILKNSALVVIDDAGHYAFIDKPKQFGAIVRAYLEPEL